MCCTCQIISSTSVLAASAAIRASRACCKSSAKALASIIVVPFKSRTFLADSFCSANVLIYGPACLDQRWAIFASGSGGPGAGRLYGNERSGPFVILPNHRLLPTRRGRERESGVQG